MSQSSVALDCDQLLRCGLLQNIIHREPRGGADSLESKVFAVSGGAVRKELFE